MQRAVMGLVAVGWMVACTDARLVAQTKGGAAAGGDEGARGGEGVGGAEQTGGAPADAAGGKSAGMGGAAGNPAEVAGGGATARGGTTCTGDLALVRKADGLDCPDTYCGAASWASSCDSFETPPVARYVGLSSGYYFVEIDWGNASKICAYTRNTARDPYLVEAAATSRSAAFCDGSSTRITSGIDPSTFFRHEPPSLTSGWSDYGGCPDAGGGAGPTGSAGAAGRPGAVQGGTAGAGATSGQGGAAGNASPPMPPDDTGTCMNLLDSYHGWGPTCQPCCSEAVGDLANNGTVECPAEGYGDYACTSTQNLWCSCSCSAGHWWCGC